MKDKIVSYVSSIVRYQRAYFQAKLTRSFEVKIFTFEGEVQMEGARERSRDLYFSRDCKCILTKSVLFKGERVSLACK